MICRPLNPSLDHLAETADKAYYSNSREVMLHVHGVEPLLPHRGTDDDTSLGRPRRVVERTIGWLQKFRRVRDRDERRAETGIASYAT